MKCAVCGRVTLSVDVLRARACAASHPPTHPCTHVHTHTHAHKYVMLTAFPLQQLFRERALLLRSTCIACLVLFPIGHKKTLVVWMSEKLNAIQIFAKAFNSSAWHAPNVGNALLFSVAGGEARVPGDVERRDANPRRTCPLVPLKAQCHPSGGSRLSAWGSKRQPPPQRSVAVQSGWVVLHFHCCSVCHLHLGISISKVNMRFRPFVPTGCLKILFWSDLVAICASGRFFLQGVWKYSFDQALY